MKKMNRIISVFLCLLLCLSVITPSLALAEETENYLKYPTVYVEGQGSAILRDKGTAAQTEIATRDPEDLMGTVKELMPLLVKAITSGNYTEYEDALVNLFVPIYDDIRLGKDGNPVDNSECWWSYDDAKIRRCTKDADGYYSDIMALKFNWDWRRDPYFVADQLNEYIEDVCRVLGVEKVNLVSRSMGPCVTFAYADAYGYDRINKFLIYASTAYGNASLSGIFSGRFDVNLGGLGRYLMQNVGDDTIASLGIDATLADTVKKLVYNAGELGLLNVPEALINAFAKKVAADIMPQLIMGSYGSFPSIWTFVQESDYEAAKKRCFAGHEEEYAEFIEKIDHYHYDIQVKLPEIVKDMQTNGVEFCNVAKYGAATLTVIDGSTKCSDDVVDLASASIGATTSEIDSTLGYGYIHRQKQAGLGKYISPDEQVDASTCASPDTTWFVKGMPHRDFPDEFNEALRKIIAQPGATVDNVEGLPQFLVYNTETFLPEPMTKANSDTYKFSGTFAYRLRQFFRDLKDLFESIFYGFIDLFK